jgi:hypothetical protein
MYGKLEHGREKLANFSDFLSVARVRCLSTEMTLTYRSSTCPSRSGQTLSASGTTTTCDKMPDWNVCRLCEVMQDREVQGPERKRNIDQLDAICFGENGATLGEAP